MSKKKKETKNQQQTIELLETNKRFGCFDF